MFDRINYKGKCALLHPYGVVDCDCNYHCDLCFLAYDIRKNKREQRLDDALLFSWRDTLKMTPKGGGLNWYRRPVILKPDSMRAKGITVNLINQILFCDDGSGCFACNPAGMVDGFLVIDRKERYTFTRHDIYGVPNEAAVAKYYELYGIDLNNFERKV